MQRGWVRSIDGVFGAFSVHALHVAPQANGSVPHPTAPTYAHSSSRPAGPRQFLPSNRQYGSATVIDTGSEQRLSTSIHEHNNAQLIYEAAGQSVFGIKARMTVAAQMEMLVADMNQAWGRVSGFVQ